jgi:hypothetical protein
MILANVKMKANSVIHVPLTHTFFKYRRRKSKKCNVILFFLSVYFVRYCEKLHSGYTFVSYFDSIKDTLEAWFIVQFFLTAQSIYW